jgi:predicted Zn-dependent protease
VSGRVTRVVLAGVAVLVIAWLAVLARDSLLEARVSSIAVDPRATPAELQHGLSMATQARLLNPDRSVPLSWQAEMYVRQHRPAAAIRTYQRLVSAEPQFADAWFLIAAQAATIDPKLAAHARAQLLALDPLY